MITRHDLYGIPWIDLENPTTEEIRTIIEEFNINESCAIELMHPSLRAKVDRYDNYLFFVLHFPDHPANNVGGMIEIDFVVHDKFIITTRYTPIDTLLIFEKKHTLSNKSTGGKIHGGIMFGLMINDLYDGLIDELTLIKKDITDLENKIFTNPDAGISQSLLTLHRKLLDCKSALRFHHEIMTSFEHESVALFGESYETTTHMIMNRYYHLITMLDSSREIVQELRETYDALLTNKTNDIMRTLTLMSFITFPLSLIAIILFDPASPHIFHGDYGFEIVIGILFFIFLLMMMFFKKKKWL